MKITELIKFFEQNHLLSLLITITISITIFWVSSLVFPKAGGGISFSTVYHFFAFFFLCLFLLFSIVRGKNNLKTKNLIIITLVIAILYSISDEIHQYFVPSRAFTFYDIMVNSLGIIIASLAYTINLKLRKK